MSSRFVDVDVAAAPSLPASWTSRLRDRGHHAMLDRSSGTGRSGNFARASVRAWAAASEPSYCWTLAGVRLCWAMNLATPSVPVAVTLLGGRWETWSCSTAAGCHPNCGYLRRLVALAWACPGGTVACTAAGMIATWERIQIAGLGTTDRTKSPGSSNEPQASFCRKWQECLPEQWSEGAR